MKGPIKLPIVGVLIVGVLIAGFFIYMTAVTRPYLTTPTPSDKEKPLLFEIWEVEGQINRIDEALKENWFPAKENQVVLAETKKALGEKLAVVKKRYEEAKKETARKIVEKTLKKTFPSKTVP